MTGEPLGGIVVAVAYVLGGVALLLTAILPRVSRALTPAMVFVGAGFLSSFLPGARPFHPQNHVALVEHVTELCVIVALLGVGLALDRPFTVAGWSSTWRLLLLAMPLFIAPRGGSPRGGSPAWPRARRCSWQQSWRRPTRCSRRMCGWGSRPMTRTARMSCASR